MILSRGPKLPKIPSLSTFSSCNAEKYDPKAQERLPMDPPSEGFLPPPPSP
jgi:hypothetical protein